MSDVYMFAMDGFKLLKLVGLRWTFLSIVSSFMETSRVVTGPQLNWVNTPIGNNKISLVPPSFEVSQTPLRDFEFVAFEQLKCLKL
jgi:hypothetical protein